jgi:tetratricopeptide (TPR) repeat protein
MRKMKLAWGVKILGCIGFMLLSASAGRGAGAGPAAEAAALMASPTLNLSQGVKALSLYQEALAGGGPRTPLLTSLARTCFVLGQVAPQEQRMAYYRQGQSYAETLLREAPGQVEGHYWLAMNLCGQADEGGKFLGRKLLPRIMEELRRSLALNEAYDRAGAHRVLGRIYYEAPGWPMSVGDLEKSRQHLEAAVRLAPAISTNHLYLAETLMKLNETAAARQQLELVLRSRRAAVRPQDLEEDRAEARRLLGEL